MLKNFFKTAWRNLGRSKLHSFINIGGLSIGMAVAISIGLWIKDELSFNKNFRNYDRIAQVIQNVNNNGEVQTWWSVPFPLADELRKNYGADFEHIVMGANWGDHTLTIDDQKIKQKGGFFEKEMPEMFTLDMIEGKRDALKDPSSVLISASAAKALYNTEHAMNKTFRVDQMPPLKVAGVYADFPQNSTLAGLSFVGAWDFFYVNANVASTEDPWRPNFTTLFVQLKEHADIAAVSAHIKDAKLKRVNEQLQKKKPALFLHALSQIHLYSEFKNGVNTGGAIQYVWMFGIIGIFVLMLACINFMNLSTARSERRAREVGIRKTAGSTRRQLIIQFFSEALLTVVFAFALAILFVWLTIPFFNTVAEKKMSIPWADASSWLMAAVFILLTSVVAGSYPAIYLSSFRPVAVLKGTFKAGRFAAVPRKVLVVLQFTVSVTLIIGTLVVYSQIQYAKNRPIGYSRSSLLSVPTSGSAVHDHLNAVRDELTQTGVVGSLAESESPTTGIWNSTSGFSWPGKDPNLSTDFGVVSASFDYGKTINWQMKEGRDFSRDFGADTAAVILNEAAVHFMNLKDPLGQQMTWWDNHLQVIGVVHDMVIESPYEPVRPIIYTLSTGPGNMLLLRLKPSISTTDAIGKIGAIMKRYNPDEPFEYKFVNDEYDTKFSNESKIGNLAKAFAFLAIVISCLGLFGLTSFVAEQRKKEIGVRKVLGASVLNVWRLMSKDFLMLVLASFVVAIPLSYYFMHNWLQHYSYRTTLSWVIFAAATAGCLLITLIVVSIQTVSAALANPVTSLRSE